MVQAALGSRRIAPLQKRGRRIDIGRGIVRIEFENPVEKAVVARGIGSIRHRDAVQFHLRKFLGRMFGHGERLLESIITQIVTHLIVHVAKLREDIGQQPLPRPARRPERLFLSVGRQRPVDDPEHPLAVGQIALLDQLAQTAPVLAHGAHAENPLGKRIGPLQVILQRLGAGQRKTGVPLGISVRRGVALDENIGDLTVAVPANPVDDSADLTQLLAVVTEIGKDSRAADLEIEKRLALHQPLLGFGPRLAVNDRDLRNVRLQRREGDPVAERDGEQLPLAAAGGEHLLQFERGASHPLLVGNRRRIVHERLLLVRHVHGLIRLLLAPEPACQTVPAIRHPPPVPPVDHHARKIAEVLPVRRTQLGHERPALAGIDGPVPDQELELQPQRIVAVHVEPLACHPNVPAELGPERSGTSGEGDEQRNEQKIEFPHADKSYL